MVHLKFKFAIALLFIVLKKSWIQRYVIEHILQPNTKMWRRACVTVCALAVYFTSFFAYFYGSFYRSEGVARNPKYANKFE